MSKNTKNSSTVAANTNETALKNALLSGNVPVLRELITTANTNSEWYTLALMVIANADKLQATEAALATAGQRRPKAEKPIKTALDRALDGGVRRAMIALIFAESAELPKDRETIQSLYCAFTLLNGSSAVKFGASKQCVYNAMASLDYSTLQSISELDPLVSSQFLPVIVLAEKIKNCGKGISPIEGEKVPTEIFENVEITPENESEKIAEFFKALEFDKEKSVKAFAKAHVKTYEKSFESYKKQLEKAQGDKEKSAEIKGWITELEKETNSYLFMECSKVATIGAE